MRSLTLDNIPKPMLSLNNRPMIQWQIDNLSEYGVKEICIITGHLGEKIEEYFGTGDKAGIKITYVKESEPLGSAGALYYIKEIANGRDIILVFGDVMFRIDWDRMIRFHEEKKGLATLLLHPNSHPHDSDLVVMNEDGMVTGFDSKLNKREYWYDNLVNAGIYILKNEMLDLFTKPVPRDLEKDVLVPLLEKGKVYGYRTPEYVKDAGTPQRFYACREEQAAGVWKLKCLDKKQRAVFLDRDGTINKYKGLIVCSEQLELEEGVADAIRRINASGYLAICVTNQPVVARGQCSIEDVNNIHRKLQTLLGKEGAYLDDIVFCPHHPDRGYEGENPAYKIKCDCRKPATGMVDRMAERYNIDLSQSWVIGDTTMDVQLGRNVGARTILVKTGQAGADGKYEVVPDYEAENLMAAVSRMIGEQEV